jgi:hypothetical protein
MSACTWTHARWEILPFYHTESNFHPKTKCRKYAGLPWPRMSYAFCPGSRNFALNGGALLKMAGGVAVCVFAASAPRSCFCRLPAHTSHPKLVFFKLVPLGSPCLGCSNAFDRFAQQLSAIINVREIGESQRFLLLKASPRRVRARVKKGALTRQRGQREHYSSF